MTQDSMNTGFSAEEPRSRRTQTLSPVSPKPIHYPSPSSIPVLENQMDPVFNDTSTHTDLRESSHLNRPTEDFSAQQPTSVVEHTEEDLAGGFLSTSNNETDKIASAGTNDAFAMSVEPFEAPVAGIQKPLDHHQSPSFHLTSPSSQVFKSGGLTSDVNVLHNNQPETSVVASIEPNQSPSAPSNPSSTDVQAAQPQELQIPLNGNVETGAPGAVNFQALLDNLTASAAAASTAPDSQSLTAATTYSNEPNAPGDLLPSVSSTTKPPDDSPTPTIPGSVNLPPRPPQLHISNQSIDTEKPVANSHDQTSSGSPSQAPPPGTTQWNVSGNPPPLLTAGAPGTSVATANGLPPPPVATFQQSSQSQPNSATSGQVPAEGSGDLGMDDDDKKHEDEDIPWGAEVQKLYDEFLEAERKYVLDGKWDRFPMGSRLFIGNLPTEKVTKRDLYHVFYKHGKLAQISIKQAYGFVQFLTAEDCARALKLEEGVVVRGRKIHLEISKPQRNTKNSNNNNEGRGSRNRRSRSPDANRSGNNNSKGGDRYRDRGGNNRRGHDAYRPGRSPSPRRRRSPDRYNGRRRSRSPGRRFRSPDRSSDDDTLPLPRRHGKDVPDVQILATDALDRKFIQHVERTFELRGVGVNVLLLGPRLSETAVMRRQILEGVHAVMKLSQQNYRNQKYQLSVFDRSAGNQNVRFDEYQDLDLNICVELVVRAKQQPQRPQSGYGVSQYGLPVTPQNLPQNFAQNIPAPPRQQFPPPPPQLNQMPQPHSQPHSQQSPTAGNNDISSTINNMDTASLQQLLGSLQQQSPTGAHHNSGGPPTQPPQFNQSFSTGPPDPSQLARLLNSTGQAQPPTPSFPNQSPTSMFGSQRHQQPFSPQNQGGFPGDMFRHGSAAGSGSANQRMAIGAVPSQQHYQEQGGGWLPQPQQGHSGHQAPSSGPDMQNIMAQLARYGGR